MNSLPSFFGAFCTEFKLALARKGVLLLSATPRETKFEKARMWANSVAHGIILQEPLLTDNQHGWTVRSDKHSQVHLEGFNLNTNHIVHRFSVRLMQRVNPIKYQNLMLGQSNLMFGRCCDMSWNQASKTVYDAWQQEIQQGRLEWNSINPTLVRAWQKTLLSSWKGYFTVEEKASSNVFLDFCLGVNDTYFVNKITRKEQLHIVGISRTGRLGMPKALSPVTVNGTAELLETDEGIFLEVPMTYGNTIRVFINDHKNSMGLAIRVSLFLNTSQAKGVRIPLESTQTIF